jgi:bifunctional polynucleotide phosphatase/kinase
MPKRAAPKKAATKKEAEPPKKRARRAKEEEDADIEAVEPKSRKAKASESKGKAKESKGKAKSEEPKGAAAAVGDEKEPADSDWTFHNNTLMWAQFGSPKPSAKLACFDFDGCLAKTSLFKKGPDAWSMLYPSVPAKVKALYDDGYKLVIFTNQSDIGKAAKPDTRAKAIAEKQGRLSAFVKETGLPWQVFVATVKAPPKGSKGGAAYDSYRKPATGMWDFLISTANGGIAPNFGQCFFVGDAAGRPKDHGDTDKGFAKAVGLTFHTEDYLK